MVSYAISRLIIQWGILSLIFFHSPFRRLLKIVQIFKDSAIFDLVMKEIFTETQNKNQQIKKKSKNYFQYKPFAIFTISYSLLQLFLISFHHSHNFKLSLIFLLNCLISLWTERPFWLWGMRAPLFFLCLGLLGLPTGYAYKKVAANGPKLLKIVTTPTQPQLNSKVGCDTKMTLIHHPPPPPPTTHHHPHKLNVSNIAAVTDPISTKL